MLSRSVIVLYGAALLWGAFWFFAFGSGSTDQQLYSALALGLPPLLILVVIRWMTTGRLP
jgi:hypothetical protein